MSRQQFLHDFRQALLTLEQSLEPATRTAPPGHGRRFVQHLGNLLFFLRLLETRGWPMPAGHHEDLRTLWGGGGRDGQTVYRSRLLPRFTALSSTGGAARAEAAGPLRIPPAFAADILAEAIIVDVPDAALAPLIGARGVLYEFRFSTAESTGSPTEERIHPELLGTVLEEFLSDRDEQGTFYTSRPVVDFMCREALCQHLTARTQVPPARLRRFVEERHTADLDPSAAGEITRALADLQAIDPACGSGAYLLGLLRILVDLRESIAVIDTTAPRLSRQALQQQIVSRNLHGVDIHPLATLITRQRLWLALAGAADAPAPGADCTGQIQTGDALAESFPLSVPVGGFDLVLANPPYVRHERIPPAEKRALQRRFAGAVTGQSDLYCHFFARSLELLRDKGVFVCICSASWLDSGFGTKLQGYLLEQARIVAIYDTLQERQFAAAAINTVISVITRQTARPVPPTRFVVFQQPLGGGAADSAAQREVLVEHDELWDPTGLPGKSANRSARYRGGKWGGRYLRAPESYLALLRQADSLISLGQSPAWEIGRGLRTGCDEFFYLSAAQVQEWLIEPEFLVPLVRSPVQFRDVPPRTSATAGDWFVFSYPGTVGASPATNARRYLEAGAARGVQPRQSGPWYKLDLPRPADLLLPIAFHERYFLVENDTRAVSHQRFCTICLQPDARALLPALGALLSSSLTVLAAEVLGRRGLGQGALDFPPDDWRSMLLPDPAQLTAAAAGELEQCWRVLTHRPPLAYRDAVRDPDHQRLDGLVGRLIGRDERFMEQVRQDALALMDARLHKARTAVIS